VLRNSADRQLYDRKFQNEGALTLIAFADNATVILVTINQMIVLCVLLGSHSWISSDDHFSDSIRQNNTILDNTVNSNTQWFPF